MYFDILLCILCTISLRIYFSGYSGHLQGDVFIAIIQL